MTRFLVCRKAFVCDKEAEKSGIRAGTVQKSSEKAPSSQKQRNERCETQIKKTGASKQSK